MQTNNITTDQYIEHEVQIRLLNAKHDDLHKEFGSIDRKFEAIDRKFEAIDRKFEAIDRKFEAIDQKIDQKFDKLDSKIESRFLLLIGLIITSIIVPVVLHSLKLV